EEKGRFDAALECSAVSSALQDAMMAVRPGGTIVQVGVAGNLSIPLNILVGKEITLRGSHRFDEEFARSAMMIDSHHLDVGPIITWLYSLDDALSAFEPAVDTTRSV